MEAIKRAAFKAAFPQAGAYYGDGASARRRAESLAAHHTMSPKERRIFIDQATHTLQYGVNAN